jgi:DtxR family Mn-dependent transcriptional regulator
MSSITLVFSSNGTMPLTALRAGSRGVVVEVRGSDNGRVDRLLGLGVTPGARVSVLQTFPGIVFLCDQTELAVERGVAESIIVRCEEMRS